MNARSNTSKSTKERIQSLTPPHAAIHQRRVTIDYHWKEPMPSPKKWSRNVKTDSTHPPERLFTKDPETIARTLASKKVSPKGPGSGMRMLTFFINRAGKNLSATEKAKLQKAKELLSARIEGARAQKKQPRAA